MEEALGDSDVSPPNLNPRDRVDESGGGPPNFNPIEGVLHDTEEVPPNLNPLEVVLAKVLLELNLLENMEELNVPAEGRTNRCTVDVNFRENVKIRGIVIKIEL